MFLLGHPKFHVVTDHNPLLRIFGDKPLADIDNPRLVWLKEKTLSYSFDIHHIEGKLNPANVFSRYPVGKPDIEDIADAEEIYASTVLLASMNVENMLAISLDDVKEAAKGDKQYCKLMEKVSKNSFAKTSSTEDADIRNFFNVRNSYSITSDIDEA